MKITKTMEKQTYITRPKRQSGMSLVELMISMVVGIFLLVGVVANFLSTTKSDIKREAISEMDANAASAFRIFRETISHAGYRSIQNTVLEDDLAFYYENEDVSNPSCGSINRDNQVLKSNRRTRDSSTKDFLTVITLADNPCLSGSGDTCVINPSALVYTDCTGGGAQRDERAVSCSTDPVVGMPNPKDAKIYSSFWLEKNITSAEDRTLYCQGSRGGAQPMVKDVETVQYLYGVKNNEGSISFRKASQVTAAEQWPMVVSVQVGLLMRSSNQYVLDKPSSKDKYNILNQNVTIDSQDLRRLFRVYTTTINLENRNMRALL